MAPSPAPYTVSNVLATLSDRDSDCNMFGLMFSERGVCVTFHFAPTGIHIFRIIPIIRG